MGNYKTLSIVQSILIFIVGWSLIDVGYATYHITNKTSLFINNALFSSPTDLWNEFAFWGYMAIIIGILEIIKALSSKD